jgi:polar amino acid transport system substrate-binding protein
VILADEIAMNELVERDAADDFEIKGVAPHHAAYGDGVGVGLRQDDDALQESLNDAIEDVFEDGTCSRLSNKYFDTDICT